MQAFELFGTLTISNFTFEDINDTEGLMHLNLNHKIEIKTLNLINYSSKKVRNWNDMEIMSLPTSQISIEGLYFNSCVFRGLSFFDILSAPLLFELKNSNYDDLEMDGDISMIDFKDISSFSISNQTFSNIRIPENDESLNHFIDFTSLSLENSSVAKIDGITMSNSDISLFNFKAVVGSENAKIVELQNISIVNASLKSSRSILSTKGFETTGDVNLIIKNLIFQDISFSRAGEMINLEHLLENPVIVENGLFKNLVSASIDMHLNQNSNPQLFSRTDFNNCTFTKIQNPQKSLMHFSKNGNFSMKSSSFIEITSTNDNSGIVYLSGDSYGVFIG